MRPNGHQSRYNADRDLQATNESSQQNQLPEPSQLDQLPVTYQAVSDYYLKRASANPTAGVNFYFLREETYSRIERITGRPLICYVTKTNGVAPGVPAYIDDSDLVGFSDLIQAVQGENVDILIVSNGGSPEASERIVHLLRERFKTIRFIVPANAFSAATLICFSGDEILMDSLSTLGPIDPQINGIPARAILRAFETLEERLIKEGPRALTAYMPLIGKYDLHLLEICKSAVELSRELASKWLSEYMLMCSEKDDSVDKIVEFFSDYDVLKSHGRSIDRKKACELGLKVTSIDTFDGLPDLVRSLYNQYVLFFEQTPFYKLFECRNGINWGRQALSVNIQLPFTVPSGVPPLAPPGPPARSN